MCSSPLSCDLDIYLPCKLDLEEILSYQSPEMLIRVFNFDTPISSHRIDSELFDPFNDDMEASLALTDEDILFINRNIFETNDINDYSWEQSTVIPHVLNFSNESQTNDTFSLTSPASNTCEQQQSPIPSPSINMYDQQQKTMLSPSHSNCGKLKTFSIFDKLTGRRRRPLLYEFIRLVLDDDQYSHLVEYVDRKQGIFKIYKPQEMAELWQQVKGRNSNNVMTYDKFARAIRYYYRSGIIHGSPGRFTFRFGSKSGFGTTWWPTYQ